MNYRLVAMAVLVAATASSEPLDPTRLPGQYAIDAWNVEQGLPASTVNTLVEDPTGYVWLGTYEGLVRFDGIRMTLFHTGNTPGLGSDGIRALASDERGRVWVGTNGGGLSVVERGAIRQVALGTAPVDQMVWALAPRRRGGVWVGTNGGGLFVAGDGGAREHARLPELHAIFDLHEDDEGTVWVGTQGGGLWRLDPGGGWGRRDGIPHHDVRVVRGDGRGGLLVGTIGGGAAWLPKDGPARSFDRDSGLASDAVYAMTIDAAGTLWIGTTGGLARVRGDRVDTLGSAAGLPDDVVYALLSDSEGNLWAGTNAGGVARIRNGAFLPFGEQEGLSDEVVWPILQTAAGDIVIGTKRGVDRLDAGRFVPVTSENGPCGREVHALADDAGGALWIGTYGHGVCRVQAGRVSSWGRRDGLGSDTVRAVLPARDGSVWVGTVQGLSRFRDGRWTNFTRNDGLPHDSIMALHEDARGVLWIGTSGGGLVRRSGDAFEQIGVAEGLASSVVFDLLDDGTSLWVGTNAGISRVRGREVRSITPRQGLPVGSINQIVDDAAGSLWVGSGRGILRIPKADLDAVAEGRLARLSGVPYDRSDGLRTAQCSVPAQPAGLRSRDGRLWFTTVRGLAVFDPSRVVHDEPPPGVAIESVTLDDRLLPAADVIDLPPAPDRLAIRFAGLCPSRPERLTFRYRLVGFDPDFVEAGASRLAHYTRLPPGAYTFEVEARDGDGVRSVRPAKLELRVAPFFWQQRPFQLGAGLAVIGLVLALHRWRTRSLHARTAALRRQVEERTRGLRDATARAERSSRDAELRRRMAEEENALKTEILGIASHDLKSPLTVILGLVDTIRLGLVSKEEIPGHVETIGRSAEKMNALLQDLLSTAALETGHVELRRERVDARALLERAARDLQEMADRKSQLIEVSGDTALVEADELRLLQVLENLGSNALKFSGAGTTTRLHVESDGDIVRFRVEDEGPGLRPEDMSGLFRKFTRLSARPTAGEPSTGLGLSIVKRLVELQGGRVRAESDGPGRGATFVVELPPAIARADEPLAS